MHLVLLICYIDILVSFEKIEVAIVSKIAKYFRQKEMCLCNNASDKSMRQVILFGEHTAILTKPRGKFGATGVFVWQNSEWVLIACLFTFYDYYSTYLYVANRLEVSLLCLSHLFFIDIFVFAIYLQSICQFTNVLFPFLWYIKCVY